MARSLSLSKGREGVSENRRGAHWAPVLQGDTMRIVFMGTPDLSRTVLEALLAAGHELVLAVTQPDREKGRGKALQMSPVKELALERGIPVYQPERIRREESVAWLEDFFREKPADIGVVAAFGQILPQRVLDMPRLGCLNVHTSLLPKYRGAAPIQQAILAGEKETGVTIMQMDAGLDTGDILLQRSLPIEERETGGSLTEKLAALGGALLCETLSRLEDGLIIPIPQMGESSYAPQIRKEQGLIDWNRPAEEIERQIRAFDPWPGSYTFCQGKRMILKSARLLPEERPKEAKPGCVLRAGQDCLAVACGRGVLRLERLKPEGKKEMEAAAYLRGCALSAGDSMGEIHE